MSRIHSPRAIRTPLDRPIREIADRFGNRSVEMERFIKFLFVGTIGFVVDFGTLNLLQSTLLPAVDANGLDLQWNVTIAISLSFFAGVMSNFTWNRYWTYPDSRTRKIETQLAQFFFINFVGWAGRTVWVTLAYPVFGDWFYPTFGNLTIYEGLSIEDVSARIGTNITLVIGVFVVLFWNFFANRYWTYSDVDSRIRFDANHHN